MDSLPDLHNDDVDAGSEPRAEAKPHLIVYVYLEDGFTFNFMLRGIIVRVVPCVIKMALCSHR